LTNLVKIDFEIPPRRALADLFGHVGDLHVGVLGADLGLRVFAEEHCFGGGGWRVERLKALAKVDRPTKVAACFWLKSTVRRSRV